MGSVPLYERRARTHLDLALATFRVVQVTGARQVGKTTLARSASRRDRQYATFDDPQTCEHARRDPAGFVASFTDHDILIDEVQRAPEVYLAIKRVVDESPRKGRVLLTGSSDPLTNRGVQDSLAGRLGIVELRPLSQGEIARRQETFLEELVSDDVPLWSARGKVGITPYLERILAGGFPEAVALKGHARQLWFDAYLQTVLARDVRSVVRIEDLGKARRLVDLIASHSGQLLKPATLARDLDLAANTARSWIDAVAVTRVIDTIPAWSGGRRARIVRTPRAYVCDSGLLAAMLNVTGVAIARDAMVSGALLETFVIQEVLRQRTALSTSQPVAYHYRDRDQREVDLVLERPDGGVIGIEIKATARVTSRDLSGLRALRRASGDRYVRGVVVYCGEHSQTFPDGTMTVPLPQLWA